MQEPVKPFLKWPGGKRWAAKTIAGLVSAHLALRGKYIEPFLGGAAVFFHLKPHEAVLSDLNQELIDVYKAVKRNHRILAVRLRRLPVDSEYYYRLRSSLPKDRIGRAVRFLYLNRTSFAGMYRVNRNGQFNVPFGDGTRTAEALWRDQLLRSAANCLSSATLMHGDFQIPMRKATRGDVVYCDPTYTVAHNNNCFVRYNERNFSWRDQKRLYQEAIMAVKRGATVIISNAYHPAIRRLYSGWPRLILKRFSAMSTDVSQRERTAEYLFILCSRKNCTCQRGT
jgi:DNA adenine methylase